MKKSWMLWLVLVLVAAFTFVAVAGCEVEDEEPAENDNNNDAAVADEEYDLDIATTWPSGILLHEMAEMWAEYAEEMSGGRLNIEVHPSGAIVSAMEVLDATQAGTIDGFHGWSGYWMGDHGAQNFFASTPMAMETDAHIIWMYDRGLEYQEEVYAEMGYDVKPFLCGATHPEMGAHSNVPLEELEDWVGTTYRVPGWMAQILEDMGVSVAVMEGGDVYPALETGEIDAGEFSSPVVNHELGFHEVTDYFTGPGIHQPTCMFELVLSQEVWEDLPPDLQAIVENATYKATNEAWTEDVVGGYDVVTSWMEDHGNEPVYVSDEAQLEFREHAWDFISEEVEEEGPLAEEIWEDQLQFFLEFIEYDNFMTPHRQIPEDYQLPEEDQLRVD